MTDPILSIATEHGRYYVHPSKQHQVPSITNVKNVMHKDWMKAWAARRVAEYAAENIQKLAGLDVKERVQLMRYTPFERSEGDAANIGDIVHDWIDRYIKGDTPTPDEIKESSVTARGMWRQFGGLIRRYNPQFVMSEFTVWSDTYGYAGTGDWVAKIGDSLILADTKTGKGVYPETAMQLAALAKGDYILESDGTEKPVPKFDRFAVYHLRPRFSQLLPVERIDEAFEAFLGCKKIFDWEIEHSEKTIALAPKIEVSAKDAA